MRSSSVAFAFAFAFVLLACATQPTPHVPAVTTAQPTPKLSGASRLPPSLRLPASVVPKSYALTMRMSPTEERIGGRLEVDIEVREPTSVVWMHAGDNLTIRSAMLSGGTAMAAHTERANDDLISLSFDDVLQVGPYRLAVSYEGKLPSREERGAYRQEERGDWYIFTQFESTAARRAFPCFDEPGFKTPYQVTLEVPKEQLAFANTPQTSEKVGADGWKTVTFAPSKPLPSYLVAFAVGPFEIVDAGKAGKRQIPVRIIVPKGRSSEAKYAAETTGQVVERLESYFGIPYPYEKLDHIAVPQKNGAMENPGLITFGTGTMLGKPEDKSIRLERGYLGIAAHELGHIWFGDYVTMAWWDDLWLNEAFASWIAPKIVHAWHPDWDGAVNRVQSKNGVMGGDALVSARRIRQPIESKHDIVNAFDSITYQKGAAVIGMFEAYVGEESFRKGVHDYLERHAHGNATATDLLTDVGRSLSSQGNERASMFAPAFSTFLDQPGVPFVSVELSCETNKAPKLLLSQQRYFPQGSTMSGASLTWDVPVCASYPGGKSCVLMTAANAELPLTGTKTCPAWVNPNAGSTGYYRVLYKGDLLSRLTKNAVSKALSIDERVGVLGDALALVRNGHIKDGEVLALVPDLVQEGNRHLVGQTVGLVAGLSDHFVSDAQRPNYRRMVNKLYAPRARQLGWHPKSGEDDGTRLLRPGLLSLVAKDEQSDAASEARKLTEAWLTDKKAIDHDLISTVLWVGGRSADRALWDKLHAAAKATKERKERGQILGAMSAAKDPALVELNFQVAMSDELDPRESFSLVWGAGGDSKTRQMAYDFVKTNYDRIIVRMPRDWGAQLAYVASGFCDAEHLADAESFFKDKAPKLNGGPRVLAQVLEGVSLCQAQRAGRQSSVAAFLARY